MIANTVAPEFLKLLAHDVRWQLVRALTESDLRVHELVAQIGRPMNLVSYHLRLLRQEQLIHERRSSADGRDMYYTLDLARLETLYQASGSQLHPALGAALPRAERALPSSFDVDALRRVLFLCSHNRARSQMAEGLLRHLTHDQIAAFSAGDQPGEVHVQAVHAMATLGIDIRGQRSKHLDEFRHATFDRIITVCDRVREQCPTFPGDPQQIHWSIADPLAADDDNSATVFLQTAEELRIRIRYLLRSFGTTTTANSAEETI